MKKGLVYWIHFAEHNDPHTEGYVGVTNNLERRIEEHKNRKENLILQNIFKKNNDLLVDELFLGEYNFCFDVENEYRPEKFIGWNINKGGFKPPSAKGLKRSEETKLKISLNNVGFRGRKHSQESKVKMSNTRKKLGGRPHTEETKKKLSEIAKLRNFNPMLGRKHSEKTKQLISAKKRNKKHTQHTGDNYESISS